MINIDWSRLISPAYWFEGIITSPGSALVTPVLKQNSTYYNFFLYLFGGLIVAAILLKLVRVFLNNNHPLVAKIPFFTDNLIWMGILGYIWFITRQLSVAFLGARFWLIIGSAWFLAIAIYEIRYLIKFFPLELKYYKKTLVKK